MTRKTFIERVLLVIGGGIIGNKLLAAPKEIKYEMTKGDSISFIKKGDGEIYYDIPDTIPTTSLVDGGNYFITTQWVEGLEMPKNIKYVKIKKS